MKNIQQFETCKTVLEVFHDDTATQQEIGQAGVKMFIKRKQCRQVLHKTIKLNFSNFEEKQNNCQFGLIYPKRSSWSKTSLHALHKVLFMSIFLVTKGMLQKLFKICDTICLWSYWQHVERQ